MAKRKQVLNAALKALLAGLETSAWVKIPATFISQIASLPKDKRDALDTASAEKFGELLTQAELSTTNAALAAVGTEQLKVLVSNLTRLSGDRLDALKKLTQNEFDEIKTEIQKLAEQQKVDHEEQMLALQRQDEKLDKIMRRLEPGITKDTKRAIEKIFLSIIQEKDIPEWQWPEKLQAITQRHQDLLDKWQSVQSGDPAVDKLRNQARRTIELGNYDKADKELQDAIEIDRKAIQSQQKKLDQRKLSMARSLASRADIAETKLDYKKAIDLYKQALDILPQNQQTIQSVYMNNLGLLYHTVANYEEAEPLMQRALKIDEASFGKDHPKVAIDLNNLAQLYQATNRLKEAEPLMERALNIDEASLGKDHPDVARDLNNLAQLYQATNRLKEAEPLYKRVVKIFEKSLGPAHPNVATALNNLALLYQDTNRLKEAEPLMKRVVEILQQFTRRTGHPHPHLKDAINNYEVLLMQMGYSKDEVAARLKRLAPEMFE